MYLEFAFCEGGDLYIFLRPRECFVNTAGIIIMGQTYGEAIAEVEGVSVDRGDRLLG